MNLNKKITGFVLLVIIIFTLCQGFVMHYIISSSGEKEIQAIHKDEKNKAKQKLKNYVEIAYNIIESNYENSQNKKWLQKEYGLQLNKIIDIAESLVTEHIILVSEGKMRQEEAQQRVLHAISKLRYDVATGYVWINEIGHQSLSKIYTESHSQNGVNEIPSEVGMGYVWVNDMGKPYPKMLMHPTIPQLDGKVLDDRRFNCAQGVKKNLFVAMREAVEKEGEGFVDYVWPKPTKDGLAEEQQKLSYVRSVPEWNWIIGTGIYVDDALDKAIEKSKQDLKKMRYSDGEGYFWINDAGTPYPKMVMHPTMPQLNGKVMLDPKFNVVLGEPKHLFKAIIRAAEIKDGGFVNYIWPKPTKEGLTTEERKLSFVRTFAPFGWIIGTGIYIDSIDLMVEEKINTIKSTNFYLLMAILSVAVILFFFLTTTSYLLIDRLFIRKINQANDDLQLEIEERKKTEKELIIARKNSEVANSAKSEFLANMSHEIRTPMNAVIGLAHLLKQTDLNKQQQEYLIKITFSADNLLSIINNILDFSKIEAGKLELENIPFHLRNDILQNVTQVVGLTAAEKGLEVMLDLEPDLPDQLVGDPVRLRQILINLMNNAVKFTEQGDITLIISRLESTRDQVQLRFEICDTGIGMSKDQLKGLFTAFSQADASTTRKFGGTGLGLTISKTLAEMMGGKIGANSVLYKGSTFWFSASFTLGNEDMYETQPQLTDDIKNLKVLVVDNNKNARFILTRQLAYFGFQVTEAESGEEAIFLLQSAHPDTTFDLILLDWMMPGMDGFETAQHLRSGLSLKNMPAIIMLTAYDKQELMDKTEGLELQAILTKPIFPSELLNAILSTFGKNVAVREKEDSEALPTHVLGANVLLVEDNLINQEVAREILEIAGVYVTIAEDGEKGIEQLKHGDSNGIPFDVVLMDIQMPVMDGYTAAHEIRNLPEFQDLPIIAMTANAFVSDRQKALEAGMNDHVAKPINVKELFKIMGEFVHVPKDRQGHPKIAKERHSPESTKNKVTDVPNIEGLDIAAGIQRAAGNIGLYEKLLKQFVSHHANDAMKIKEALAMNDIELASRLAHTQKGIAGNIGAESLYQITMKLELAIEKADQEALNTLLPQMKDMLQKITQGVQDTYLQQDHKEKQTKQDEPPMDHPALQVALTTLRDFLTEDDPEAIDFFMEKKDQLSQLMPSKTILKLEESLQKFEFETSLDVLDHYQNT